MASVPGRSGLAALVIVLATVTAGLAGSEPAALGDGTATVDVVEPTAETLSIDRGRFGADVSYLRLPDLVVDVSNVTGRPRVVYAVRVPALGLDRVENRLIREEGRLRVSMADRAYPPRGSGDGGLPEPGTYDGRLVVRVQSFASDRTVRNRTIQVRVSQ
jgi:hypothetical protein